MKKSIYICHPFTTHGDPVANFECQAAIGQLVFEAGFTPVSPILAFGKVIPHDSANYARAMEACLWLLSKCDQLWVFGEHVKSTGCMMEVSFANKNGITVRDGRTALLELVPPSRFWEVFEPTPPAAADATPESPAEPLAPQSSSSAESCE